MNNYLKPIALSIGLLMGMTAYAQDTNQTTQTADKIIDAVEGEKLFFECATLINDAMRLACYDSLAQGEAPNVITPKRQIELSSTIKNSIKGDRKVVYATTEIKHDKPIASNDTTRLQNAAERYTPLSLAYDLDRNNTNLWTARPYNPMYILPLYFNANPNRHPGTPTQDTVHLSQNQLRIPELKFQLSVKSKAADNLLGTDADLWLGYTQQSHWQVYNEDSSRPFRVHDYQPELFITQPVKADLPFGGKLRMLGAGAVHHSNGEKDPVSRSWNRAYIMAGMEWDKLTVMPRLWTRIAAGEDRGKKNDNPDILDYYGYGDVKFLYQVDSGVNVSGTARYNPFTNRGALQLDYVHPIDKGISSYIQLFHGYGQSLIDYNQKTTGVGLGVMLTDWMGL